MDGSTGEIPKIIKSYKGENILKCHIRQRPLGTRHTAEE